jgi:hypothetical protein
MHAPMKNVMRASIIHRTLNITPGALVFGRDIIMFLDIPLVVDLMLIRERRQHIIDENVRRTNLIRRFCDYKVPGGKVLVFAKA